MTEHLCDTEKRIVMLVTNPVRPSRPDPRVFREAKALRGDGHAVTIVAWDRASEETPRETLEGIDVVRIQSHASYGGGVSTLLSLPNYWRRAAQLLRQLDWDVIHCHDLDTLPVGYRVAKKLRRPVVFDAHESYPDFIAPRVPKALVTGVRWLERYLVKRVHAVIAVGEQMAEKYRALGARNTVVIGSWHNPNSMLLADEERARIRKELGVTGLMVVYAGSFGRNRALFELIEAVQLTDGVDLVLAGDGNQRREIERRIMRSGSIKDLGTVPYARALQVKASADVIYRVTRADQVPNARFSAPNGLFEALASGVAVIGGDNGDLGDILREEECGIVLSDVSATGVRRALNELKDPVRLHKMKENALDASRRKYNWDEARRRLLELYSTLC